MESALPAFNGEDVYLNMVRSHLALNMDVLDVACSHGEVDVLFNLCDP